MIKFIYLNIYFKNLDSVLKLKFVRFLETECTISAADNHVLTNFLLHNEYQGANRKEALGRNLLFVLCLFHLNVKLFTLQHCSKITVETYIII